MPTSRDAIYEWGIGCGDDGIWIHRSGLSEDEARTWLKETIAELSQPGYFYLVKRQLPDWEEVDS